MSGGAFRHCLSLVNIAVPVSLSSKSSKHSFLSGFETDHMKAPAWIGGETEALLRLDRHLERKAWVASFGRPKMTPQSLLASQAGLSPYLRFGCVSTRLFYHLLGDLYRKVRQLRKWFQRSRTLMPEIFFFRFETQSLHSPCSASCCGASFCSRRRRRTRTLTRCSAIPSASRSRGTRITKRWPSGPPARQVFPGSMRS